MNLVLFIVFGSSLLLGAVFYGVSFGWYLQQSLELNASQGSVSVCEIVQTQIQNFHGVSNYIETLAIFTHASTNLTFRSQIIPSPPGLDPRYLTGSVPCYSQDFETQMIVLWPRAHIDRIYITFRYLGIFGLGTSGVILFIYLIYLAVSLHRSPFGKIRSRPDLQEPLLSTIEI